MSQGSIDRDQERAAPALAVESLRAPTRRHDTARIPRATYRWQFNSSFTFQQARALVGYLDELGVSDVYASPYLKASRDSTHGYDVVNHRELNPAIGSRADYQAFVAELQRLGLGQLMDIVPNHMGIATPENLWWMSVLEHGPSSPYADYFDITWDPPQPELTGRVLLPFLGDQYGVVLENGQLQLRFAGGAFRLHYHDLQLPIAPETYPQVLQSCLGALAAELGPADPRLQELQAINSGFSRLPSRQTTDPTQVEQRQRETVALQQRLAALAERWAQVRGALEATLGVFNGVPGQPTSFDLLDGLLGQQAYRLAFWRVAADEINYRRFFDINQLAAIRVEREEVFRDTHQLVLELLANGSVTGLRIDHPDGLWDPVAYLRRLQRAFVEATSGSGSDTRVTPPDDTERPAIGAEPVEAESDCVQTPLYIVVEKILSQGEQLRADWAAHGTTGYDFANALGGLFVDADNRRAFDDLYARFIHRRIDYHDLINSTRKLIMLVSLASEVSALAHRLHQISEHERRLRDFTFNSLAFAIREVIGALPVYRTYAICGRPPASQGQTAIERAVAEAERRNPRTDPSIFRFIRDVLLLRNPAGSGPREQAAQCEFVMKFQQTSGTVMAKGIEDTAFYVYNRLVALNEVGGEPAHFGVSLGAFHQQNQRRRRDWPHSLLTTSTHDTKRSEDVRARISVLSELPREFSAAIGRWSRLNARCKRRIDGAAAPDRNDEYLIYQTLLGAWPLEPLDPPGWRQFVERMQAYLEKATREAKVHTSWINPNAPYDQAVREFVAAILDPKRSARFLTSFEPLQRRVAHFGLLNGLAQVLLKLTAPGVPDLYQGCELWDFSLVDPDNRRPVDYQHRQRLLAELRAALARQGDDLAALASALLAAWPDGRVKLYVTHRALDLRRRRAELFKLGDYTPLYADGRCTQHLCAFARELAGQRVVVAAPRLTTRLVADREAGLPLGRAVWGDSSLPLGAEPTATRYRDCFTGRVHRPASGAAGPRLHLAELFADFPLALLERLDD